MAWKAGNVFIGCEWYKNAFWLKPPQNGVKIEVSEKTVMESISEFTPEQAWTATLSTLQNSLPKATFDSWIKPLTLISYTDGVFSIGCSDIGKWEWLDDRMKITVERTLSGFMRQPISVRFVVLDLLQDDPTLEKDATIEELEPVDLNIQYSSIRNSLLEPDRVVRLPIYFLRWLPYIQSQVVFVVIALWQEYYLACSGKTHKGNFKVAVRAEKVCQWAGVSRAQFFRLLQPGSPLEWFTRKCETDYEVDQFTGRTKKSANKYILYEMPLTPGDAMDIKNYLLSNGIKEDPENALRTAIMVDPKEILTYPIRLPTDDFDTLKPGYVTVQEMIRGLVGKPITGELANLADQFSQRVLAQGEFILVSWYFLKHWLPKLGPEAAMFILVLRNLCYFNDETGDIRDEVWIEGGYEAVAQRLGIKDPRVVAHWLPAKIERGKHKKTLTERTNQEFKRRKEFQDLLGLYITRTDARINSSGSYAWKFKVQRVDPLIPQHELVLKTASNLFAEVGNQGLGGELDSWIYQITNDCSETLETGSMVVSRLSKLTNGCSETLGNILKDCLGTLELDDKDCFETLLKILKNFKDSLKNQYTYPDQDSVKSDCYDPAFQMVVGVVDSNGNWSLEKLLGRASEKIRQELLNQVIDARFLVSWIIYGATQVTIQNPYNLAISKLRNNPGNGAGGAYDRLAFLPPVKLADLIQKELVCQSASDPDWQTLFSYARHERIHLLAEALGLDCDSIDQR